MKGSRTAWLCLLAVLAVAPTAVAQSDPAEVTVEQFEKGERIDVQLPGALQNYVLTRRGDGGRDVVMLIDPDPKKKEDEDEEEASPCRFEPGASRSLWRLDSALEPRPVLEGLPPDTGLHGAADVDGDGEDEVFLSRPGELLALKRDSSEPDLLLRDPELNRWTPGPGSDGSWFPVPGIGFVRFHPFGRESPSSPVEVELPVHADQTGAGFYIHPPVLRLVGRDGNGLATFASDPERVGSQRLRVHVVRPGAASPEARAVESWARFPVPEHLLKSSFHMLEGEPVLVALTMPAGQVNLFGELRVRVFPLLADRSRTGRDPLLAFKSECNLLQSDSAEPQLRDLDGDGRPDLLLSYLRGFGQDRVVLDAYLREEDGTFATSPKTTAFGVKKAGEIRFHRFGDDLTGDGAADLLVMTEERAFVFAGRDSSRGNKLASSKASHDVPLVADPARLGGVVVEVSTSGVRSITAASRPRPTSTADLDGDGRPEVLTLRVTEDGQEILSVIRLPDS